MTAPMHQRETDDPAVAPYAALHETHSAIVLLVGDRAYKVKKPVDLGFLDFSTPTKRLRATQRELELNRRFAPDVYWGISDLNDPDGRPVEHLLTMRRMPAAARLAHLVRTGEDVSTGIVELAANVAALHRRAPRGPQIDACGRRDAVQERWRANLTEARPYVGEWLDADAFGHVDRLCTRYLEGREPLFAARIEQGAVLDGHGDLLAQDVFLLSDGPRILDCLDFDDRLRYLDRIDDVACLVMDLEHLGAPAVAHRFLQAYLTAARDDPPTRWSTTTSPTAHSCAPRSRASPAPSITAGAEPPPSSSLRTDTSRPAASSWCWWAERPEPARRRWRAAWQSGWAPFTCPVIGCARSSPASSRRPPWLRHLHPGLDCSDVRGTPVPRPERARRRTLGHPGRHVGRSCAPHGSVVAGTHNQQRPERLQMRCPTRGGRREAGSTIRGPCWRSLRCRPGGRGRAARPLRGLARSHRSRRDTQASTGGR